MLGQYFILWRVILQSEFSVSLFKAAGDILLKKAVLLLTVTTCIQVSKALSVFQMSISALIFAGTIYRLELICHSLKVFCCMIRQHFYWFTTNFVELPQMHTFVKNVMFTAFQNLKMEFFFLLSQATMYLHLVNPYSTSLTPDKYHKSTVKPHGGLISFKHIWPANMIVLSFIGFVEQLWHFLSSCLFWTNAFVAGNKNVKEEKFALIYPFFWPWSKWI